MFGPPHHPGLRPSLRLSLYPQSARCCVHSYRRLPSSLRIPSARIRETTVNPAGPSSANRAISSSKKSDTGGLQQLVHCSVSPGLMNASRYHCSLAFQYTFLLFTWILRFALFLPSCICVHVPSCISFCYFLPIYLISLRYNYNVSVLSDFGNLL